VYLASRTPSLPRLVGVTGRWDFAPGTLGLACAAAFIALHASVLLGINIAFGQRRDWHD
jgi:ABC-type proline/glycine betaine transport system permease subunit